MNRKNSKICGIILVASVIMGFIAGQVYALPKDGIIPQDYSKDPSNNQNTANLPTISEKYNQLGGINGFLGAPFGGERIEPDGIGMYQLFQGGNIHWSPKTGAHEVHGDILKKYAKLGWETSFLGYPVTDETGTPDGKGRFNHFQGGSIYSVPGIGTYEVHGAIRQRWASLGWERSFLGYPISDEISTPSGQGRYQYFEGGIITWSPETGALEADKSTPVYIFRLDKFHIDNTRSRHEDTDVVSFALKVGDQIFEPKNNNMGNVNNGDHEVDLEFGPIPINDATPALFNYIIVNAGHSSAEDVSNGINKVALNALRLIPVAGQIPGIVEGMQKLSDILFANCDGTVAQDQISVTGATLKDWTSGGPYSEDRFYPGTDSAVGCGSNSKYTVTWSISRLI